MKKILFLFVFALTLVVPVLTKADGGMIPPNNYWIRETQQKAAIVFEKNTEILILSTTFEGDAKNFAWIIPTPTQPEVTKAPYNLFDELEELTQEEEYSYSSPVYDLGLGAAPTAEKSVTVLEEKKVDIYDITVLSATDKTALYNWLKENKYNYPADGKYILDDYIQHNWVFTAVKIDSESLSVAGKQLRNGTANPLKLVFSSDKIVFPLKISAITSVISDSSEYEGYYDSDPYIPIQIYIFADHKKEAIGFDTDWAGWVKADEIKKLALDEVGEPWYNAKNRMFLTKISDSIRTSEMKNDVFPVNADNNSPIPPSNFWAIVLWAVFGFLILLILPTTLFYVIFMLLFIFIKAKVAKVIFLIVQGFIALIIPAIFAIMSLAEPVSSLDSDRAVWFGFLFAIIAMLVIMAFGMVLEIVKARKKKLL